MPLELCRVVVPIFCSQYYLIESHCDVVGSVADDEITELYSV